MSEQTPITGSFIWTLEDVKTRQAVLSRIPMTAKGKLASYALTGFLIVIAFAFIIRGSGKNFRSFFEDPFLASMPFVVIIVILVFSYSRSANLKKAFLQSPDHDKRIDVTLTCEEIILKAEGIYENKWEWGTIKEVQRNPKGFCFFLAEQAGIWIPIRAFASQAEIDSITEFVRNLSQEMPSMKYNAVI